LFGENNSVWIWSSLAMMLLGLALVSPKKKY
jgi:LPXTG-motif cell wall-anchored protein